MAEREIDRFYAQGESGQMFEIVELEEVVTFRPLSGASKRLGGAKRYVLKSGGDVSYVQAETFKILDTGEIVRRIR